MTQIITCTGAASCIAPLHIHGCHADTEPGHCDQPAHHEAETEDAQPARLTAERAEERGQGICRTCLLPIWNEGGTIHYERRETGWSDRVDKDSLVCFQAVSYQHVPLEGREAAIYDRALGRDPAGTNGGRALIEADLLSRSVFR